MGMRSLVTGTWAGVNDHVPESLPNIGVDETRSECRSCGHLAAGARTIYPDPLDAAIYCGRAGAYGITAHLREDRRHIQDRIFSVKKFAALAVNLEMANVPEMV